MLIAFHKPYGVLCQFTADQPGQRTLADFDFPKHVYPLGRLDMDSEGLLLLTDEANLNDTLLNPKNAHLRSYLVQVEGIPNDSALLRLSNGTLIIQRHRCLPCSVKMITENCIIPPRNPPIRVRKLIPDSWIQMELYEGKNRQVRRMTAAVGHPTLLLIRSKIGSFSDPNLTPGTWRILSDQEKRLVFTR
jgi:23S rRNA pseudouridine2457 synthase